MPRYLTCRVPPEREGCAVKTLLLRELRLSESLIARTKLREDGILLNGVRVRTNARVRAGDLLAARVDDTRAGVCSPAPLALSVLFEDEDLLIIDKPAGLASHGPAARGDFTVAHALAAYLGEGAVFHPVSRLDRGTSGVMTLAKNGYMHDRLRQLLHTEDFYREYLAFTLGAPEPGRGVIELPLGRAEDGSPRRCVRADGSPARTDYDTLRAENGLALVHLLPRTGRTHQLRVHMAAIGCPLAGDFLYGASAEPLALAKTNPALRALDRPALHSARLTLRHPLTGELLRLCAPLPVDLLALPLSDAWENSRALESDESGSAESGS